MVLPVSTSSRQNSFSSETAKKDFLVLSSDVTTAVLIDDQTSLADNSEELRPRTESVSSTASTVTFVSNFDPDAEAASGL